MVITESMAFQIKFHHIRAFVEVAREGSIRGASRALAVSQPALTKAIKELEEGLSAQLFVRRSQGVALTENGESFYQHASLILEELRAAQDELLQRQGEQAGQINIGLGASVARSLMGELMDHHWTMPTPRGSYFKQLQDRLNQAGLAPKVDIVCETFSSCISLVVKSDFLSILPVELGNDPLMADKLVMIPVRDVLPTATYYLIQRRDTRQTPLTASLITLFRRQSRQLFP